MLKRSNVASLITAEEEKQVREAMQNGNINNPFWRIQNLYRVKDIATGDPIKPILTEEQLELVRELWDPEFPTKRHLILKSRQVFMTTISVLLALDLCVCKKGTTALFGSFTEDDSSIIFDEKVRYICTESPILKFYGVKAYKKNVTFPFNKSLLTLSSSGRGSNPNFVVLSDYAKMCAFHPTRAEEMLNGILTASELHPCIIESTSMGAGGLFWELCNEAHKMRLNNEKLNRAAFRFHFFAWWTKKGNRIAIDRGDPFTPTKELAAYFADIERQMNIKLDDEQKKFYSATLRHAFAHSTLRMNKEHPSTIEEAFATDVEAKVLLKQMKQMRSEGRIHNFPRKEGLPVLVFWDFGKADHTAFIAAQRDEEGFVYIFDSYKQNNLELRHFLAKLEQKNIQAYRHVLPHDAVARGNETQRFHAAKMDMTIRQSFAEYGHNNILVLPRLKRKSQGFTTSRERIHRVHINSNLLSLIQDLEQVQRNFVREARIYVNELQPHNSSNHYYDCVEALCRTMGEYPGLFRAAGTRVGESEGETLESSEPYYEDGSYNGEIMGGLIS